jgi:sporulation protein YlmC with PRC-barrel domain
MQRSVESLYGYSIRATDGDIGKIHEFYFDDETWTIRYLVVDTGSWLLGRRVLLSTAAVDEPGPEKLEFPVALTKEQVERSPHISSDKPVSRQMEENLHTYYGWIPYWTGAGAAAAATAAEMTATKEPGDPHLRSTREVTNYHIHATDGEIGHVEDFIVEGTTWIIRYMIVNTRNWLPGRSVLVAPAWVSKVSWAESKVSVDLDKEMIKNSPEFDPSAAVNREYELRLYDYYGRPKYWTQV